MCKSAIKALSATQLTPSSPAALVQLTQLPTVIEAQQLLGQAGTVLISHGGEHYQLTRTKQNKLLLTKCAVPSATPAMAAELTLTKPAP